MKILVVHPPMYPVNHEFYNMLAEKVNLTVFQIGEHPEFHTKWTNENIRKGDINYKLKIFSKGKVTLKNSLNPNFLFHLLKEKPDVVLSIAFWIPSFYLAYFKYILNYKFVILTNMIEATEKNISSKKQLFRNLINRNVDHFISASNLTSNYLRKLYPLKSIILSTQTMNVSEWKKEISKIENKNHLIEKLNIAKDKKIMLGIGNYIEKKNWKMVLESIKNIDNILFLLVGSGIQEEEYKDFINQYNLENKVKIVGRKDGNELLEYYKISDFLIFPSFYDQFGFVVPEALASGLPVICTKNAGAECLIQEGINGYIINPLENFEFTIEKTIENLESLKNNVLNTIENFTLENRVNEFENIFKKIMDIENGK